MHKISVVVTVKNEGDSLQPLLDSLTLQTLLPTEVVISDGGSTDGTLELLQIYKRYLPLEIVDAPGSNISEGRNRAIERATGEIIAVTDGGVVLAPHWLEAITQPIRDGGCEVVSGWFEADPYTDFEVVMGATVLPRLSEIDPNAFLPSSRSVAFTKQAWQTAGGYPEWLDYGEDLIFDLNLRVHYGAFPLARRAVAYFRPRPTLRAFAKQYYLYARGDGKANLWPRRHLIRYSTYLLTLPLLLRQLIRGRMFYWPMLLFGVVAYCWRPWRRLWQATTGWRPAARLWAFALTPVIRFVGDVAKMVGYPPGVWWRLRRFGRAGLRTAPLRAERL